MPRWLRQHPEEKVVEEKERQRLTKKLEKCRFQHLLENNALPPKAIRLVLLKRIMEAADELEKRHVFCDVSGRNEYRDEDDDLPLAPFNPLSVTVSSIPTKRNDNNKTSNNKDSNASSSLLPYNFLSKQVFSKQVFSKGIMSTKNLSSNFEITKKQKPRRREHKRRVHRVLQQELVPAAANALCLLMKENNTNFGDDDDKVDEMQDETDEEIMLISTYSEAMSSETSLDGNNHIGYVLASITLLLSNMLLGQEGKGYDALVRHALKMASVSFLTESFMIQIQKNRKQHEVGNIDVYKMFSFPKSQIYEYKQKNQQRQEEQIVVSSEKNTTNSQSGKHTDVKSNAGEDVGETSESPTSVACADMSQSPSLNEPDTISEEEKKESNHDNHDDDEENPSEEEIIKCQEEVRLIATRKFEALEKMIAKNIYITLLVQQKGAKVTDGEGGSIAEWKEQQRLQNVDKRRRKLVIRGMQITSIGVVAGGLFALSGGLAGPAIAAGIAGLGLTFSASQAAAIAMLTTVKAAAALFGVSGGSMAAYKMKKRTAGLSEFTIRRENIAQNMYDGASESMLKNGIANSLPQLHTTICLSGWLQGPADYQKPWGVQPTDPPITDNKELLRRFFTVYAPEQVQHVDRDVKQFQKKQGKSFTWKSLWTELSVMFGRDPDHLLPLDQPRKNNDNKSGSTEQFLTNPEQSLIDQVLSSVLFLKQNKVDKTNKKNDEAAATKVQESYYDNIFEYYFNDDYEDSDNIEEDSDDFEKKAFQLQDDKNEEKNNYFSKLNEKISEKATAKQEKNNEEDIELYPLDSSPEIEKNFVVTPMSSSASLASMASENRTDQPTTLTSDALTTTQPQKHQQLNLNLDLLKKDESEIVWDWQAMYGGDLHTITWESKMLLGLDHIIAGMSSTLTKQATRQALQYTAIVGSFFAAVAPASTLSTISNLIDDPYQIAILRADETGKELARCLLQSEERRPVTLIGYSFGARAILSCLIELARHQQKWEYNNENDNQGLEKSTFLNSPDQSPNKHDGNSHVENEYVTMMREPASIVEDVVFMGLPRTSSYRVVSIVREMTNGRVINCYSRNDWLLSVMFVCRGRGQKTVFGAAPANHGILGIENYDVTDFVESHTKYGYAVPKILEHVGLHQPTCLPFS